MTAPRSNVIAREDVQQKVFVPAVGWASRFTSGDLQVCYNDGVQITLSSDSSAIYFTDLDGLCVDMALFTPFVFHSRYGHSELLPATLKTRLAEMPYVIEHLAKMSSKGRRPSPNAPQVV